MMILDAILDAVAAMTMAALAEEAEVVAAMEEAVAVALAVALAEAMVALAEVVAEVEAQDLLPTMLQMDFNVAAHHPQIRQSVKTISDPWHCEQSIKQGRIKDENSTLARTTKNHVHSNGQTSWAQPPPDIPTTQTAVVTVMAMRHPFVNAERTVLSERCARRAQTKEECFTAALLVEILGATTLNGLTKCNHNSKRNLVLYVNRLTVYPPPSHLKSNTYRHLIQ